MTSIQNYDPAATGPLPPAAIGVLVAGAVDLLQQGSDLPQPRYITISTTQSIDLQFTSDAAGANAVTRWAMRFGGVLTAEPHEGQHGLHLHCTAQIDYYGVRVTAYALIPTRLVT